MPITPNVQSLPRWTEALSGPNQFAGRTTIQSGAATQVVSTQSVKSDSLILFGRVGNANLKIIGGTVQIASNAAIATVSNAAIGADSLIFLSMGGTGGTDQTSGLANPVEVKSQGAGSMDIGYADGNGYADRATTVNYLVAPADGLPSDIEVKTITDGAHFTLGHADGVAKARDTILLWEIVRADGA